MGKIALIIVIIIAVILGVVIAYFLEFAPAVELVESVQESLGFDTGEINISNVASIASLGTAATTAIGYVKKAKDAATAQASAAKATIENSGLLQSVKETKTEIETLKTDFNTQLKEANKIKEEALAQASAAKDQAKLLEEEVRKKQSVIDDLHNLIPEIKNEVVQQKVVI